MAYHRINVPTEPYHSGSVVVDKDGWAWQKHKDRKWHSVRTDIPGQTAGAQEWAILLLRHGPVNTFTAELDVAAAPRCDRLVRDAVDAGVPQPPGFRCALLQDHVGDCEPAGARSEGNTATRTAVDA